MFPRLCWLSSFLVILLIAPMVRGQSIITNPLSVTSACPGTSLDVTFTTDSPYNSGNLFTVELSDGGSYRAVPSGIARVIETNRITAIWRVQATIPTSTSAGSSYRIRVSASSPVVTGLPASTSLTVQSVSPAPTTAAVSFCQNTTPVSLSATTVSGGSLTWYTSASAVTGSSTAILPTTNAAGVQTYYVAQTVGNSCESQRVPLVVTVKEAPVAPTVPKARYEYCQNAPVESLTATGQNLKWYTVSTGGTSSTVTPAISTTATSQSNYYVSQTVDGCESARAAIAVVVNPAPTAPITATISPAYCQNVQAAALTANGQNLKWYRTATGGTSLGSSYVPRTDSVGSFTYYVSQTVGGCESSRSSVTVNVLAQPARPAITNTLTLCQRATSTTLTATGTALTWYDGAGGVLSAAPVPSTESTGTVSYFVTQTVNNCESQRAEIKVIVKPTPAPPATTALAVCQNTPSQSLSATGQNLQWYMTSTGGTSTTVTPSISTTAVGQETYYVSQVVDGCPSPRASLVVTVKPVPTLPTVMSTTVCQFAEARPVTATGQNLTWYTADGTQLTSAPTPATDKGGSFTYLVSQRVEGCESNKASLSVTIATTPTPTVNTSIVEICQGATPVALEASGQNLRWIDPYGNVTTTAPAPPTLNGTIKPEGDVYYVTQTGSNGCESPRLAIRVFVQTPPTMSISGTTTVNLGQEAPLKLSFTGVGPYRFKLSNGLSGTSIQDTTILVLPERTTVYQVAEVANKCGVGLPGNGASITVTVTVPVIQTLGLTSATICAGTSLSTRFITAGSFNPGSVFKLQMAKVETDTSKAVFSDVVSGQAENGQITGAISATTAGGRYWVRVVATNPKIPVNGYISPTVLTVRSLATATLSGSQNLYEGQPASLTIAFTGEGPWRFSYRDSSATTAITRTATATTNPYLLETRPNRTTTYFLTSVSNDCGVGTKVNGSALVSVIPLLSIEDQSLDSAVDVYPIPATTTLTVQINGLKSTQPAILQLIDLSGRTALRQETRQTLSTLSVENYPAGTYVLHIQVGNRTASRRIVKR